VPEQIDRLRPGKSGQARAGAGRMAISRNSGSAPLILIV